MEMSRTFRLQPKHTDWHVNRDAKHDANARLSLDCSRLVSLVMWSGVGIFARQPHLLEQKALWTPKSYKQIEKETHWSISCRSEVFLEKKEETFVYGF